MLAYKNISSIFHEIKRKYSNTYTFKTSIIQSQCNAINKQCSLNLGVAFCVYLDIPNILKLVVNA